jgi:hypothetical protein
LEKSLKDMVTEQHGTGIKYLIRTFNESVPLEIVQGMKKKMHVLSGNGWCMRERGYMPIELKLGQEYLMKGNLEKGESELVVRIQLT